MRLAEIIWRWGRRAVLSVALLGLACSARAAPQPLFTADEAVAKGVVNGRISLFSASDRQHVLDSIGTLDPGMIYASYVGVWGVIRQQDIDQGGQLAGELRRRLPRAILGAGMNESVSLSIAPQKLACGGSIGTRTFAPGDLIAPGQKPLGDTAWLDLSTVTARDYYRCVGTMLIDRGYTLIGFAEHENVIAHASSKPQAVRNFVAIMDELRRYGAAKGERIYFSGDPATDDTAKEIDFLYVPARFFHTSFAQKYQNRIARPGIGVGYSYSLSPLRVRDVLAMTPSHAKVLFYVDNWDPTQDDLRRFMELDGANRRYLLETSAATAHDLGAYFIPNLLHCIGCIPPENVGDPCEAPKGQAKTEYDAFNCGDLPTIRRMLDIQK